MFNPLSSTANSPLTLGVTRVRLHPRKSSLRSTAKPIKVPLLQAKVSSSSQIKSPRVDHLSRSLTSARRRPASRRSYGLKQISVNYNSHSQANSLLEITTVTYRPSTAGTSKTMRRGRSRQVSPISNSRKLSVLCSSRLQKTLLLSQRLLSPYSLPADRGLLKSVFQLTGP
jgi:hypothetical protein